MDIKDNYILTSAEDLLSIFLNKFKFSKGRRNKVDVQEGAARGGQLEMFEYVQDEILKITSGI